MEKREMETGVISFFLSACKIALYLLLIVIVAQILGVATSSVVAIVGSAGLAIGLALQGSLAIFAVRVFPHFGYEAVSCGRLHHSR